MIFVAELGLNHDGNFDLAYEMIRQAKISGANIVKFQFGWRDKPDEINHITDTKEAATFENTIVALERTGETLDKVSDVFFNLLSSNTNDQMDILAQEISPKLSSHRDSILLNKDLYRRVKSVYDSRNTQNHLK